MRGLQVQRSSPDRSLKKGLGLGLELLIKSRTDFEILLLTSMVIRCHAAFLPGGSASTIISQETAQNSGVLLITPLLSSNVHYIQPKETRG